MERLLTARHWQIFILIISGLIIGNIDIDNDPSLSAIFSIIGVLISVIYPLAIGHSLQDYLPKKVELNHNFFLINFFIWITVYSVVMIISEGKDMTFDGLIAIPFFYVFYAFVYTIAFPARTLKSIELGRKATTSECMKYFFMIVFLPIGIWFLQPRINKIIRDNQLIDDASS